MHHKTYSESVERCFSKFYSRVNTKRVMLPLPYTEVLELLEEDIKAILAETSEPVAEVQTAYENGLQDGNENSDIEYGTGYEDGQRAAETEAYLNGWRAGVSRTLQRVNIKPRGPREKNARHTQIKDARYFDIYLHKDTTGNWRMYKELNG